MSLLILDESSSVPLSTPRWVDLGWVENGWVEPDDSGTVPIPPPVVGGVGSIILLPLPGQVTGATNFGDAGALTLITHFSPGRYSDSVIFALRTWAGQRLFGSVMPPLSILSTDVGRYATLLQVNDFQLNSVPLGNDLIASIGATDTPQVTVVLDNRDQFWCRLVALEPLIAAPAGIWLAYGFEEAHLVFQAQVERVVLTKLTATLTLSEP